MEMYLIVDIAKRTMSDSEFWAWVSERDLWSYTFFPDEDAEGDE